MKDKIIIGSTAIKHHFPEFPREPSDLDYAVKSKKGFKTSKAIEYLENPILFAHTTNEILNPDELLTLKMSHICYDIKWDKHMFDIHFLIDNGAQKIESLYNDLVKYWEEYHPYNRRSDLTLEKDDFFDNNINNKQ